MRTPQNAGGRITGLGVTLGSNHGLLVLRYTDKGECRMFASMPKSPTPITLSAEKRTTLQAWLSILSRRRSPAPVSLSP